MKRFSLALSLALATIAPLTGHADPLDGITIAPEVDAAYDRDAMYGRWRDADNDGLNTRGEVLAMESLVPVTLDDQGRKVTSGLWFDPYTT